MLRITIVHLSKLSLKGHILKRNNDRQQVLSKIMFKVLYILKANQNTCHSLSMDTFLYKVPQVHVQNSHFTYYKYQKVHTRNIALEKKTHSYPHHCHVNC